MYQLQGISIRDLAVGGVVGPRGCIHVDAGVEGEKSMGSMRGPAGRKYC